MIPTEQIRENYLRVWLKNSDHDSCRSLIESGDDCAFWLINKFGSLKSSHQKSKVIELLKEFRTIEVQKKLLAESLDSDPKIWKAALEGLAYQGLKNLRELLENFKNNPKVLDSPEKCSRIDDILETIP